MHIVLNEPGGTVELYIVDQRDKDFITNMRFTVNCGQTLRYRGYGEVLNKRLRLSQLEIRFSMRNRTTGVLRGSDQKDDRLLRSLRPMMLETHGGIIYRKPLGAGRLRGVVISLGACNLCKEPVSSLEECQRCTCNSCNTPIIDLRHERHREVVNLEHYKKVRRLQSMFGPRKPYI